MKNPGAFFCVRYNFTLQNMPTNHLNASMYKPSFYTFYFTSKKAVLLLGEFIQTILSNYC